MRPEHLQIMEGNPKSIPHKVQFVEHLGADSLVHGHFGETGTELIIRLKGVQVFEANTILPLSIEASNIHIFDPETGKRL